MKVFQNKNEAIAFSLALYRRIAINDVLCGSCRVFIYKHRKLDDESKNPNIGFARDFPSDSDDENVLPESIFSTHKYCCLCHRA